MDIIFVVAILAFALLSAALVSGCARLGGGQ
jgi:hypothetical protein